MTRVDEALKELGLRFSRFELDEIAARIDEAEVKPVGDWKLAIGGKPMAPAGGIKTVVLEHTASHEDAVGFEVQFWHGRDDGVPVIQIDGKGQFRVNVNDAPIWDADPDKHEHTHCSCTHRK